MPACPMVYPIVFHCKVIHKMIIAFISVRMGQLVATRIYRYYRCQKSEPIMVPACFATDSFQEAALGPNTINKDSTAVCNQSFPLKMGILLL
jgi:hypothetical protein